MRMTYVGHRRKGPREGGISSDRHCKFYVGTAAQSRVHNEYRKSACVLNNPKKWVMLLAPLCLNHCRSALYFSKLLKGTPYLTIDSTTSSLKRPCSTAPTTNCRQYCQLSLIASDGGN